MLAASPTMFAQRGLLISSGKSASALREAGGRLERNGRLSRPPQGSLISEAVVEAALAMVKAASATASELLHLHLGLETPPGQELRRWQG